MERVEHEKQLPEVVLNSGHKMPVLGLGTGKLPPTPTDALVPILIDAIQAGYRHFDTAAFYQTEEAVGQAVAQAIERGLIKSRHDMFITSKLWCSDAHPHLVLPAIKTTLKRLGMEYLDLYLIHWPVRFRQRTTGSKLSKEDILPFDIMGTWEAMEECSRLGLTKSIGVCNFGTMKLSQILHNATIPPAVNQVEMNPSWQQRKLQDFCKEKGIHVTGSSPLGVYGAPSATNTGIDYTILEELAAAKRKSISQIILRSIIQQGVSAVPRSYNKQRMKQNLQIFDWELTDEEMNKIKQISQRRLYAGDFFVSEAGPYKSLEELWDGDP